MSGFDETTWHPGMESREKRRRGAAVEPAAGGTGDGGTGTGRNRGMAANQTKIVAGARLLTAN